eukprot:1586352-Prymnesium_polylepis.1
MGRTVHVAALATRPPIAQCPSGVRGGVLDPCVNQVRTGNDRAEGDLHSDVVPAALDARHSGRAADFAKTLVEEAECSRCRRPPPLGRLVLECLNVRQPVAKVDVLAGVSHNPGAAGLGAGQMAASVRRHPHTPGSSAPIARCRAVSTERRRLAVAFDRDLQDWRGLRENKARCEPHRAPCGRSRMRSCRRRAITSNCWLVRVSGARAWRWVRGNVPTRAVGKAPRRHVCGQLAHPCARQPRQARHVPAGPRAPRRPLSSFVEFGKCHGDASVVLAAGAAASRSWPARRAL